MLLLLLPMRPTKFRFAVDSETSPSAIVPPSPAQAPQPGLVTSAPLSMSVARMPLRIASNMISFDPGVTIKRTPGSILRPFRIAGGDREVLILPIRAGAQECLVDARAQHLGDRLRVFDLVGTGNHGSELGQVHSDALLVDARPYRQ